MPEPDAKTVLEHCAEKVDDYWWCVTCEGQLGTGPQPNHETEGTGDAGHAPNCPVRALAASEARAEAAVLLAFQMQQAAAAIQNDPDKANAVSAAWVIDLAGRLLAALASGEVKETDEEKEQRLAHRQDWTEEERRWMAHHTR